MALTPDAEPMAQRTSDGAARILREVIPAGQLKPREPLRERSLAEELKISRTPIREALFILQGEGLVDLARFTAARQSDEHNIPKRVSRILGDPDTC